MSASIRIGIAFSKLGLSPNTWTILTLVPLLVTFVFLIEEAFLFAAGAFVIYGLLDVVDGAVARVMGKVTRRGEVLDRVVHRYAEGILLVGLLFASLPGLWIPVAAWLLLLMFGALMSEYGSELSRKRGVKNPRAFIERRERLGILFLGFLLAVVDPLYLTMVIVLLAFLSNVNALHRIALAFRVARI